MDDKTKTKIAYFSVDPEGIVKLARDRYWFEDQKQSGVNILRCFIGIEPYQITQILEGNATINRDRVYEERVEEDFKQKLNLHLDYLKHKNMDDVYLDGIKVNKRLLEEYSEHVVKRLRDSMKKTAAGIMLDVKDMEEILGLEYRRVELHDAILKDAGFDRNSISDEACGFTRALDNYVDAKAGTLLTRPLIGDEMSEMEAEMKRKQSDAHIAYLNRMQQTRENVMRLMRNDPSYT
jgi:hypothetical protein